MGSIIEREDGYLILDNCKRQLANKEKRRYWVYIDGVEYYFKPSDSEDCGYNELIAYYAAKLLEIDCCFYDLACLNGVYGVISKSLRHPDQNLIAAETILDDYIINNTDIIEGMLTAAMNYYYYDDTRKEMVARNMKDITADDVNNLAVIEKALEFRYAHKYGFEEIQKLMDQIIRMFIFTILLKDYDKHSGNYMFIEGRDTINLAPLLDNGLIFHSVKTISLSTSFRDRDSDSITALKNFLVIYSNDYLCLLQEMLKKLNDNFDKLISQVEDQIKKELPHSYKNRLRENFKRNSKRIEDAIEKYTQKRKVTGVYKPKKKVRYKKIA